MGRTRLVNSVDIYPQNSAGVACACFIFLPSSDIFYIVYCATLKLIFGGVPALVSGLRMEDINNIIENVPKNNGNIKIHLTRF